MGDGLNLEPALRLLHVDWRPWLAVGAALALLALTVRSGWRSKRALQVCLVLSVLGHALIVAGGQSLFGEVFQFGRDGFRDDEPERHVQIQPVFETADTGGSPFDTKPSPARAASNPREIADWDAPQGLARIEGVGPPPIRRDARSEPIAPTATPMLSRPLELAENDPDSPPLDVPEPDERTPEPDPTDADPFDNPPAPVAMTLDDLPEIDEPPPAIEDDGLLKPRPRVRTRPRSRSVDEPPVPTIARATPRDPLPLPDPSNDPNDGPRDDLPPRPETPRPSGESRAIAGLDAPLPAPSRPDPNDLPAPITPGTPAEAELPMPAPDLRQRLRDRVARREDRTEVPVLPARRLTGRSLLDPIPVDPVLSDRSGTDTGPGQSLGLGAELPRLDPRDLEAVPEIYRLRLDPDRAAEARRRGATDASEQAVSRALDWLARHQDADGRWDAGTAKLINGRVASGEENHTKHCPAGQICFGECQYAAADTAITGMALLAFLGAGHTQTYEGPYRDVVGRGIAFLLAQQEANGDLRGRSRSVGLYCHSIATLALCEAYALSGEPRLRDPVGRAIAFLSRSQARDGAGWRYRPGSPQGDTSVLGWVVMALKSADQVGITLDPKNKQAVLAWLDQVDGGRSGGLASYQPTRPVSPTMTAEAWICRQFLDLPFNNRGAAPEAALYLIQNSPSRSEFNLYYWYYGTLALYQYGGESWSRWNAEVRDELVRRQRRDPHLIGSWDPDPSKYGSYGGRVYATALATLSLEVYYRYLRLYDGPGRTAGSRDALNDATRRRPLGVEPELTGPRRGSSP